MNERQRIMRVALRRDLSLFAQKCFGTLLPGDVFRPNWHMEAISHKLQRVATGEIRRLIVTVPPRSAKSLIASVAFPAHLLALDPSARIICVSYAQPLSITFANQCRAVMTSRWYRELFPATALSPSKNTETEFHTTRRGSRFATSVGGTLTGRGANVIVIDDPIKPTDAASEAVRNATNEWFDSTVLSRLDDKTRGAIVVVMQRLHVEDLAGHLLERGGWEHLNLPAVADIDEDVPLGFDRSGSPRFHRRSIGDLLHPEREPQHVLDELRATLGSMSFSAQYLQQPMPLDGSMFAWRWFRWFDEPPTRRRDDMVVQSWDTASKTGLLNDFSVCTTWLIRGESYYLIDLHRERLDAPNLRRRVIELYRQHRPEGVLVEDKASGISLIQEMQHSGQVPVIPIEPDGDKGLRASSASVRIEAGQVLLPRGAPWLDALQREVLAFPGGRHDDQVDSMSQFLNWAFDRERNVPRIRSFDED